MTDATPVLQVADLAKEFRTRGGGLFRRQRLVAVDDVSFGLASGETLGLVGESGSGKSTVANIVAGLLDRTRGEVVVNGVDLSTLSSRGRREQRRHVQIVFQDPYASLVPTSPIESSLIEPLRAHAVGTRASRAASVDEMLSRVRLDPTLRTRFPSELSGGQLQRVSIARALALEPDLLVLDEPVSALDVCTKAEIINLLADLKDELGLSYLFISHDLSTLRVVADRIAVMYLGAIVEIGPSDEIYDAPKHPYTRALLSAVPVPDPAVQRKRRRIALAGDMPSPVATPPGCPFHTRCPEAMPECSTERPLPTTIGDSIVACHLASR